MNTLQNKIDFIALISVSMANANGDPLNGNRPRTDYSGLGEISDVCIKRKLRNRMQDMGYPIFVQSDERCSDGFKSLSERAAATISADTKEEYAQKACETWMDVRSFGQVFAFKAPAKGKGAKKKASAEEGDENGDASGLSVPVRGPVSIHQAVSVDPIEVRTIQITKSVNGDPTSDGSKSKDTMGMKHFVQFGLYEVKGSVNVQLAEKTGFSEEDADVLKECLCSLFVNDASSARPDGSMVVEKVFWWKHNCKDGQYSAAKVHRSLHIAKKETVDIPSSFDDYTVTVDSLAGLEPEICDGI